MFAVDGNVRVANATRSSYWEALRTGFLAGRQSVFFLQAEDGIRDLTVTGVQTCALPIYREGLAVQRDSPPAAQDWVAVEIAAIDDDVVRQHRLARRASRTQLHQVVDERAGRRSDLDADEPEVMGSGRRLDRTANPGAHHHLRHDGGVRRRHPRSGMGQATVGSTGAYDDPACSRLLGQRERAPERRPGLEGDHVPRLGGVERRWEVASGRNGDRASGGSDVARVHDLARTLGRSGPDRGQERPQFGRQQNVDDERAMRKLTRGSHVPAGYAPRFTEIKHWRPPCPGDLAVAPAPHEAVRR